MPAIHCPSALHQGEAYLKHQRQFSQAFSEVVQRSTAVFKIMPGRQVFTLLTALLITSHAAAENALFVIPFGSEPGAPLAHAYDYGASPGNGVGSDGTYTMRVPSVDPEMVSIVPDVELTIDAATKVVQRSYAARAYRALGDCTLAQETLRHKLQKVLPQGYSGVSEAWQFETTDGKVVGGAYCQQARHLPFPILIMELVMKPAP